MTRKTLDAITIFLLLSLALIVVLNHDALFGGGEEPTSSPVDSLAGSDAFHSNEPSFEEAINEALQADSMAQYETFTFDPNTADSTTLARLGFSPWMVRSMLKYRAKGGRYQVPEDVMAVPGMTRELYERIRSSIVIDPKFLPYNREEVDKARRAAHKRLLDADGHKALTDNTVNSERHRKLKHGEKVDLNTADIATLQSVPGIGNWRARQIVRQREKLGGYVKVEQLLELEDMPDSCLDWFTADASAVRRINLNTATVNQMGVHPYIGFYRARAIEDYRHRYGRLQSVDKLLQSPEFSTSDVERLRHYAEF